MTILSMHNLEIRINTGARPNLEGGVEATWFRFSHASILRCKHAAGSSLICIVTRDALDMAQQQTEEHRTHSLFVCQARNAADAFHFSAAVAEAKAAWTATAKQIMLQNFSLCVLIFPYMPPPHPPDSPTAYYITCSDKTALTRPTCARMR